MDDEATNTCQSQGHTVPISLRPRLSQPRTRWAVPGAAAAVVAVALVVTPMVADASPALPPRTAAELLASTRAAVDHPFSGTVVQTARLGLPDLPRSGHGASTSLSLASLITGSHTARIWYAGPERVRVALVGDFAQTDMIRSGRDAWTWNSADNTAKHLTLPAHDDRRPSPSTLTPDQAAQQALAAIDPTTAVTVEGTASVAGRSAYELVLRPRDTRSLVGQVRLAVDSTTSTPLRVEVFARGGTKPAFETAFSSIQFATPSASLFTFRPPRGAKVTEQTLPAEPTAAQRKAYADRRAAAAGERPTVVGTGWTTVLVAKGVDLSNATGPELTALLRSAKQVSGSYGSGRVVQTALVSALLLDDGRLLMGSVTPQVLEQAAAASR